MGLFTKGIILITFIFLIAGGVFSLKTGNAILVTSPTPSVKPSLYVSPTPLPALPSQGSVPVQYIPRATSGVCGTATVYTNQGINASTYTVSIFTPDSQKKVASAETDTKGNFSIDIPSGDYIVILDYQYRLTQQVHVTPGYCTFVKFTEDLMTRDPAF